MIELIQLVLVCAIGALIAQLFWVCLILLSDYVRNKYFPEKPTKSKSKCFISRGITEDCK